MVLGFGSPWSSKKNVELYTPVIRIGVLKTLMDRKGFFFFNFLNETEDFI